MPPVVWTTMHCPRCDNPYSGSGATTAEAKATARALVRNHLVRAQGADLDDGLHDNALELWDKTADS